MVTFMFAFLFGVAIGVIFCHTLRQGLETVTAFFGYVKDQYAASKAENVSP